MGIASEYDVDWDESHDAKDQRVVEALKKERNRNKRGGSKDDEAEAEDEGEHDDKK